MHIHEAVVRCLPDALPSRLDVDVSNLDLGETIHLKDLTTENLDFELSLDTTVVSILVPRALEAEIKPPAEEELVAAEEGAAEEGKEEGAEEPAGKEGKEEKKTEEAPKDTK
jgi:large subunit ribosomal protein L25